MSVNIYDPNTGQLQKIAGLFGNENIGVPKVGTYTSDDNSNADNIKALDTALVNINQAVSNVAGNVANNNDEYDSNHNYTVGEYCISPEDGTLQKCVVATSGGSWATVKDTCFEKDTLTNVVETLNNGLSNFIHTLYVDISGTVINQPDAGWYLAKVPFTLPTGAIPLGVMTQAFDASVIPVLRHNEITLRSPQVITLPSNRVIVVTYFLP